MAWFKKARKPIAAPDKTSRVPEGLWVKCPDCDAIIYTKDLAKNLSVCAKCSHHFRLTAVERLRSLFDDEQFTEMDRDLRSNDPLHFTDTKPYGKRLAASQAATGHADAIIVGVGRINGIETVVGGDGIRVHRRQHGRGDGRKDRARHRTSRSPAGSR